jgi:hypothetical protein
MNWSESNGSARRERDVWDVDFEAALTDYSQKYSFDCLRVERLVGTSTITRYYVN